MKTHKEIVEEFEREFPTMYSGDSKLFKDFLFNALNQRDEEWVQVITNLSEDIERQNHTVFDEWRAFKQFRNTLRDYLAILSQKTGK